MFLHSSPHISNTPQLCFWCFVTSFHTIQCLRIIKEWYWCNNLTLSVPGAQNLLRPTKFCRISRPFVRYKYPNKSALYLFPNVSLPWGKLRSGLFFFTTSPELLECFESKTLFKKIVGYWCVDCAIKNATQLNRY